MIFKYLYRLCKNADIAEDLTQDTFVKAIEKSNKFKGNSSISTWLCAIAKNEYLDYVRKKDNSNISLEFDTEKEEDFIHILSDKEIARRAHKILHGMNEPYKEIFMLRVFGELSFREIGELFDKSELWARVTYRRAKEKIIEKMKMEG